MIQKTKQQIYDGMLDAAHWHQQPCPIDDDFNIITIRIPNRNVKTIEEFHGFDAFQKIINFCNKLPMHMFNLHMEVENKNRQALSVMNKSLLTKISYLLYEQK